MTPLGHIVSVLAIWSMMLFGIRFAVTAVEWMLPVSFAFVRWARCGRKRRMEHGRAFVRAVVKLHVDFRRAIVTPWSAPLLFVGSAMIGFGYAFGASGDPTAIGTRHRFAQRLVVDALLAGEPLEPAVLEDPHRPSSRDRI